MPIQRLRLILVVLSLTAALFAFDFALANTEKLEIAREAEGVFARGENLLRAGKTGAALENLRRAHALERTNERYTLGLVEALLADGSTAEAANTLAGVLQNEPNDGRANLLMARLTLKTGQFTDAQAYFHRAIYGAWHENAAGRRVQVRLELVRALAAGKTADLLPELLPLEREAWNDSAVLQQVANYYLMAGSQNRAAGALQELIHRDPNNSSLYESLGQVALARGDFRAAQKAFLTAFKYNPNDARIRTDMEQSSALFALDPTPRKLRSAEKEQRSARILELAREEAADCLARPGIRPEDAQTLQGQMGDRQPVRKVAELTNEQSEQKLADAEALWKILHRVCGSTATLKWNELDLIMRKLAQ